MSETLILGAAGEAHHVEARPTSTAQTATLDMWLLHLPYAAPSVYLLAVVHLRPIPGEKPAVLRIENAEHEIAVYALDPSFDPHPEDQNTWVTTSPAMVVVQVAGLNDDQAVTLATSVAGALAGGVLPVDPRQWRDGSLVWDQAVTAMKALIEGQT